MSAPPTRRQRGWSRRFDSRLSRWGVFASGAFGPARGNRAFRWTRQRQSRVPSEAQALWKAGHADTSLQRHWHSLDSEMTKVCAGSNIDSVDLVESMTLLQWYARAGCSAKDTRSQGALVDLNEKAGQGYVARVLTANGSEPALEQACTLGGQPLWRHTGDRVGE